MFVLIYKIIDFPGALNAYDCEDDDHHPFDDVMTNQRYGTLHIRQQSIYMREESNVYI